VIFVLSEKGGKIAIPTFPFADKFLHILLYSGLGVLYSRAHNFEWGKYTFLATILFTVTYGMSDEFHQYFVPQRNSSIGDLVADGLGGMVGYFIYNILRS
jgi:VanZ family protein